MFICILTIHEYIVQVYQRKFVDIITQHVVHEALESAWGITQAQWKHSILIQAITVLQTWFLVQHQEPIEPGGNH